MALAPSVRHQDGHQQTTRRIARGRTTKSTTVWAVSGLTPGLGQEVVEPPAARLGRHCVDEPQPVPTTGGQGRQGGGIMAVILSRVPSDDHDSPDHTLRPGARARRSTSILVAGDAAGPAVGVVMVYTATRGTLLSKGWTPVLLEAPGALCGSRRGRHGGDGGDRLPAVRAAGQRASTRWSSSPWSGCSWWARTRRARSAGSAWARSSSNRPSSPSSR